MAKWERGEEGPFPERASERVRCLRKTCHTRTERERESRSTRGGNTVISRRREEEGGEEEKNGRFIDRRLGSASPVSPVVLRKFLGGRVCVHSIVLPSVRGDHEDEDEAAAAAEDIRETNEYLQITEGNAVGWITVHGSVGGKKRFGDHHEGGRSRRRRTR